MGGVSAARTAAVPARQAPARLFYILAASHSGSTLLAMLLGSHPDVCTAGELKAGSLGDVTTYRCSCGTPIARCAFWARVAAETAARGEPLDITEARTDVRAVPSAWARRLLRPLHRGRAAEAVRDALLGLSPTWRRELPRRQARNAALVAALQSVTGGSCVVDSSKSGIRLKYLLRNPALDVKVIRLVRDGRAVALTYTDPARFADAGDPGLRAGGAGGDRAHERLPWRAAVREWRRSNEAAEAIVRGLPPSRWIELRYEDLCRSPAETLRRVYAFMGVDPAGLVLDFRRREHHVVGNGMRLDATSEIRLDDRWRTALTADDLATFEADAGSLLRRLGYA
jgi:hypothetical protein